MERTLEGSSKSDRLTPGAGRMAQVGDAGVSPSSPLAAGALLLASVFLLPEGAGRDPGSPPSGLPDAPSLGPDTSASADGSAATCAGACADSGSALGASSVSGTPLTFPPPLASAVVTAPSSRPVCSLTALPAGSAAGDTSASSPEGASEAGRGAVRPEAAPSLAPAVPAGGDDTPTASEAGTPAPTPGSGAAGA